MSERGIIAKEEKQVCELCGKYAETRPYGPNGEEVCFECSMKDEEAAVHHFKKVVLGEDSPN